MPLVAATIAPSEGCEVVPAMASTAPSTMSAPAAAAASAVATPVPAVSCVWTAMGVCGKRSRRAETRRVAAAGLRRPAMSWLVGFEFWEKREREKERRKKR